MLDREHLERDKIGFAVNLLVGGQIKGKPPQLYLVSAQGNPLRCTRVAPFLQISAAKYGRPILDRGIRFGETTLEPAVKYALLSLDSTMRSNVAVGPPIDLLVYATDDFSMNRYRRFDAADPDLVEIRADWEQALRRALAELPPVEFAAPPAQDGVAFTRDCRV